MLTPSYRPYTHPYWILRPCNRLALPLSICMLLALLFLYTAPAAGQDGPYSAQGPGQSEAEYADYYGQWTASDYVNLPDDLPEGVLKDVEGEDVTVHTEYGPVMGRRRHEPHDTGQSNTSYTCLSLSVPLTLELDSCSR